MQNYHYQININSAIDVAEIHILSVDKFTVELYKELLCQLDELKVFLRYIPIKTLITYARECKYKKLFTMMGFELFELEDEKGMLYIGKMEV